MKREYVDLSVPGTTQLLLFHGDEALNTMKGMLW